MPQPDNPQGPGRTVTTATLLSVLNYMDCILKYPEEADVHSKAATDLPVNDDGLPILKGYTVAVGHPDALAPCACGRVHVHRASLETGNVAGPRSSHCKSPKAIAGYQLVDAGHASDELLRHVYGKGFKREIVARIKRNARSLRR